MAGTFALVVAAGMGERFGGDVPKQYRALAGRPLLRHAVVRLMDAPEIDGVCVVRRAEHHDIYELAMAGLELLPAVDGGATRQESVLRGLEALAEREPERVLIHDAARPLVDRTIIRRVIDALATWDGAIAAVPVTDTLKRAGFRDHISTTVDRAGVWRAQTPQGFRFPAILRAHRAAAGRALTDDAAVAEAAGLSVTLVQGSEDNLKVTTEEDLRRAERLLSTGGYEFRSGSGFDVHRFAPGDAVMLCGIRVPHSHSLEGHSDADVGLHALTDAILGSIGEGDIGQHFRPSDPRWRAADSARFLTHSAGLVRARGGTIVNLDVTLICETPKIEPYRAAMVARIAEILGLEPNRVSVKATTTEGLGFTGRREGIAAQAVVTVRLPAEPMR